MLRITAVCDEETHCPLYKKQARLEFSPPAVAGSDGAPVCAIAVESLQKAVAMIAGGVPPGHFARTFCGGCSAGKAWWSFLAVQKHDTAPHLQPSPGLLKQLAGMTLFSGVHIAKLIRILGFMKERTYGPGQEVIVRGQPGTAFYVVTDGEFEVVQHDEHQVESILTVLPPGECFGEMSLITGEPASATVRAKSSSKVLYVPKEEFQKMLAVAPEVAITLARVLAIRLTRTSRWVIDELKKGLMGRLEQIPPAELIQAMNVNNQTGVLIVQNGEQSLTLYMHDGQIHEAALGEKSGEDAFFEFLSWARGKFRFEPVRRDNAVRQVRMDTVGLLLEGMRRVDEFKQTGTWRKEEGAGR